MKKLNNSLIYTSTCMSGSSQPAMCAQAHRQTAQDVTRFATRAPTSRAYVHTSSVTPLLRFLSWCARMWTTVRREEDGGTSQPHGGYWMCEDGSHQVTRPSATPAGKGKGQHEAITRAPRHGTVLAFHPFSTGEMDAPGYVQLCARLRGYNPYGLSRHGGIVRTRQMIATRHGWWGRKVANG
jgi:hypothetical protein